MGSRGREGVRKGFEMKQPFSQPKKRAGERERNSKDKWLRPLFIGMEGERGERRRGEKRRGEGDLV